MISPLILWICSSLYFSSKTLCHFFRISINFNIRISLYCLFYLAFPILLLHLTFLFIIFIFLFNFFKFISRFKIIFCSFFGINLEYFCIFLFIYEFFIYFAFSTFRSFYFCFYFQDFYILLSLCLPSFILYTFVSYII